MQFEDQVEIEDQANEHQQFTQLHNILGFMGLDAYARSYYWAIKQICWSEKGKCFMSKKNLCQMAGFGETKLREVEKFLSQPFEILGGKPLIIVVAQKKNDGSKGPNLIKIVDIWEENYRFTKAKPSKSVTPPSPREVPPLATRGTPPSPREDKEDSLLYKDIKKKKESTTTSFFKSLSDIPIPEDDKIWLTANYDETTVNHAAMYHRRRMELNLPYTGDMPLEAILKWVCKKKPPLPISPAEKETQHRAFAKEIENVIEKPVGVLFEVLNKNIEIGFSVSQKAVDTLEYGNFHFHENLIKLLRKYKFYFNSAMDNMLMNYYHLINNELQAEVES
jgi:hypothetical protein